MSCVLPREMNAQRGAGYDSGTVPGEVDLTFTIARPARLFVPVVVITGCSLGRGGTVEDPFRPPDQPVTLIVTNNNFNDATLWVVTRSARIPVGNVTGKTDASFTLAPTSATDEWHVEIDLVGGEWCRTEDLSVDPGDILELQIALDASRTPGCYPPGQRPR